MTTQEDLWRGEFGDAYLVRNQVQWRKRMPFWLHIKEKTACRSALEIGCSAGWNLMALRELDVPHLAGIDINAEAVKQAQKNHLFAVLGTPDLGARIGPCFDLVFTAGMLIHVAPDELAGTIDAMIVASRKYVLAIEYASDYLHEEINYRGHDAALWKRPYGQILADAGLFLVAKGEVGEADGFDRCTYWLMEK